MSGEFLEPAALNDTSLVLVLVPEGLEGCEGGRVWRALVASVTALVLGLAPEEIMFPWSVMISSVLLICILVLVFTLSCVPALTSV